MDTPTHDLTGLFDQLGLDSAPAAIDGFITQHSPLAEDQKLIDAPFWTPQQATFLKEHTCANPARCPTTRREPWSP